MSALGRAAQKADAQRNPVEGVFLDRDGLFGLLEHVQVGLQEAAALFLAAEAGVVLVGGQVVPAYLLPDHLHARPLALLLDRVEIGVGNLLFRQQLPLVLVGAAPLELLHLQLLSQVLIVVGRPGRAVIARAGVSWREDGVEKCEVKGVLG